MAIQRLEIIVKLEGEDLEVNYALNPSQHDIDNWDQEQVKAQAIAMSICDHVYTWMRKNTK